MTENIGKAMVDAHLLAMDTCRLLKEAYAMENESIPDENKLDKAYATAMQALRAQESAQVDYWDGIPKNH